MFTHLNVNLYPSNSTSTVYLYPISICLYLFCSHICLSFLPAVLPSFGSRLFSLLPSLLSCCGITWSLSCFPWLLRHFSTHPFSSPFHLVLSILTIGCWSLLRNPWHQAKLDWMDDPMDLSLYITFYMFLSFFIHVFAIYMNLTASRSSKSSFLKFCA